MGLLRKQVSRFKVALALYQQMGFFSLNPSLRKMWLEKERLAQEVRSLEKQTEEAHVKLQHRSAVLHQEHLKIFSV